MLNRSVTLDSLATWTSSFLGLTLAVGDMFEFMPEDCGYVGVALVGIGIWIGLMRAIARLEQRERNAYEIGRDSAGLRAMK